MRYFEDIFLLNVLNNCFLGVAVREDSCAFRLSIVYM